MTNPYTLLWRRFTAFIKRSFSVLWMVVVAGYLIVTGSQTVYQNYQTKQQTRELEVKLVSMQNQKLRLEALLIYYQTDAYKEKELRRSLLLKRPDEVAYALPESNNTKYVEDEAYEEKSTETDQLKPVGDQPNWKIWWDYLMGKS